MKEVVSQELDSLGSLAILNYCANFGELENLAKNHCVPMIAIKHAIKKKLGTFETKLITELPAKFPAAVNLSEDFTQYGTNFWDIINKKCCIFYFI